MTSKLDAATEELNRALVEAEEKLVAAYPGVTATIKLPSGETLTFGKRDGGWGLYIVDVGQQHIPILTASRRVRTDVAMSLFDMARALAAAEVNFIASVQAATEQARLFVKTPTKVSK